MTLIARLEAATEGSRELDAEVHTAVNDGWIRHPKCPSGIVISDAGSEAANRARAETPYIFSNRRPAPHYTTSLDAALTLVPEGMWWRIASVPFFGLPAHGAPVSSAQVEFGEGFDLKAAISEYGHTPCLAFCITALKTREA